MSSTSAPATIERADERAEQAVQAADQRRRECLQADRPPCVCSSAASQAISIPAMPAGEGGEAPGQRVDAVQADAALRGEQRVLARRAHADAPARVAQESEQRPSRRSAVPSTSASAHRRRCARRRPRRTRRWSSRASRSGCCVCVPKTSTISAAQQDAERDRREHRGQHRLAGHAPHQRDVDQPRRPRARGPRPRRSRRSGCPENSDAVAYRP